MTAFTTKTTYKKSPIGATRNYLFSSLTILVMLLQGLALTTAATAAAAASSSSSWMHASPLYTTVTKNDNHSAAINRQRHLVDGDFAELNALFDNARILIPDQQVVQGAVFADFVLDIRNLYCTDIAIGDIQVTHDTDYTTYMNVALAVTGVTLNCFSDYSYSYGLIKGSGAMEAQSAGNSVTTTINLVPSTGTTFLQGPPRTVDVQDCAAAIAITNLNINGDVLSSIASLFEGLIRSSITGQINSLVCTELDAMVGQQLLQDTLTFVNQRVDLYLEPLDAVRANPLAAEDAMEAAFSSETGSLIDFLAQSINTLLSTLKSILQQAASAMGENVPDIGGPTGTDTDLAINVFLRNFLLDENRVWTLNMSALPPMMPVGELNPDDASAVPSEDGSRIMFQTHDQMTQTTLRLQSMRIKGLDTFRNEFEPIQFIGNQTVQSRFSWEYLFVEADVIVDVQPSTLNDSILVDPDPVHLIENIQINVGIDSIDADLSLFMAIDEQKFLALQLGSLLRSENMLGCLMSTVRDMNITGLNVNVANIQDPVMTGFISPGIDRVVSNMVEIAFLVYESTLLKAMPNLFQIMVRDIINTNFLDTFLNADDNVCPDPVITDDFIDWRDMLLFPNNSLALGGSGEEPYGDVAYKIFGIFKDQFYAVDDAGRMKINDLALLPLTTTQSGLEGALQFPSNLVVVSKKSKQEIELASPLTHSIDDFEFKLSDIRILNLDTVADPMSILDPTNTTYLVNNLLTIGDGDSRPLELTIRMLFGVGGAEDAPFTMRNELDLTVAVDTAKLLADLRAVMSSPVVLQFPLGHILDMNCWMSAFPSMDDFMLTSFPMVFEVFQTSLSGLSFNSSCIECSSPGLIALPDVLSLLDQSGATYILGNRFGSLASSLMKSDSMQALIQGAIEESHKLCSFDPAYQPGAVRSKMANNLTLPSLSEEAIDTLFYTGALASEVAMVVFMENVRRKYSENIFSEERILQDQESKSDGQILDWTDLGGSLGVGDFPDSLFKQARDYISGIDNTTGFLHVTKLMNDMLLDDTGAYILDPAVRFAKDDFSFSIEQIKITGFDTMKQFNVLEPISSTMLNNYIALDKLGLEMVVAAVGNLSQTTTPQRLNVTVGITYLKVNATLLAAFDLDKLKSLKLGQIVKTSNIVPCILSTAAAINFPELLVQVDAFGKPHVSGLMPQTLATFDAANNLIMEQYGSMIQENIPLLFNETIRAILNDMMNFYLEEQQGTACPNILASSVGSADQRDLEELVEGFIDLRDLLLSPSGSEVLGGSGVEPYGDLFHKLMNIVQKELLQIDPETGLSAANTILIDRFTEDGRLDIKGDLFDTATRVNVGGLDAHVRFKAFDAYVYNLNSLGAPLSLLENMKDEPHMLNNSASIGVGKPVVLGLRFLFGLKGDETEISNEMDISIRVDQLNVILVGLAMIFQNSLAEFPVADVLNANCWLATMPAPPLDERGIRIEDAEETLSVSDLAASVVRLGLNVSCVNCTSPGIAELTRLLGTPEGTDGATIVANKILDYVTALLGGQYLQVYLDRLLNEAERKCPHHPKYDPNSTVKYSPFLAEPPKGSLGMLPALFIVLVVASVLVLLAVLITKFVVRRRHQKWITSLSKDKIVGLWDSQQKEQERNRALNTTTVSMFNSPAIPFWVRWSMPFVILGNIGFFLSGHLNLAATVNIIASVGGQTFKADKFFEFSMAKSTVEIWNAGGKELAMLMLIFAGLWPYTKQFITLALWFLPPNWVSVQRRGSIFLWLDILAKWSMVDIFTLIVTITSFRVSIQSPDVPFLPDGLYSLDLLVAPKWGLYANMIAQVISQISSHFIIHYHRRIIETSDKEIRSDKLASTTAITFIEELDEEKMIDARSECGSIASDSDRRVESQTPEVPGEKLFLHTFSRPHRGESDKLSVRGFVNPFVIFLGSACSIFIILGCSLSSFSVEVLGIIGVLVESGQQFTNAKFSYSLFTMIGMLFDQAQFSGRAADFVGLGSLSILLICSVLLVPVVQVGVLLWHWFRPMDERSRYRLTIILEMLQAWQYAEVYLIAVIVASWQLGPVSEFMVNEYCGSLKDTFARLVYFGVLNERDAQCFRVEAQIESGSIILAVAAILLALLNTFIVRATTQYFRDNIPLQYDCSNASEISDEKDIELSDQIAPSPVLFTDTFRWFLIGATGTPSFDKEEADESGVLTHLGETPRSYPGDVRNEDAEYDNDHDYQPRNLQYNYSEDTKMDNDEIKIVESKQRAWTNSDDYENC